MAHFQKRHYETLAAMMQELHPGQDTTAIDYEARAEMWNDIRQALIGVFARDNHLFQADRFDFACLPGQNVKARTAHLKHSIANG